jgi:hypothetical protein
MLTCGSNAKLDLTRQLLARAEILAELGHDRAALTEAISALEVAVYRFARSERGLTARAISTPLPYSHRDSEDTGGALGVNGNCQPSFAR